MPTLPRGITAVVARFGGGRLLHQRCRPFIGAASSVGIPWGGMPRYARWYARFLGALRRRQ